MDSHFGAPQCDVTTISLTCPQPGELSAVAVLIGYWDPPVNNAVWSKSYCRPSCKVLTWTLCSCGMYDRRFDDQLVRCSRLRRMRVYICVYQSHCYRWCGTLNVSITWGSRFLGLIILGIILDLGGVTGDRIGFRYWKDPGPFVQFSGKCSPLNR